MENRKKMLRRLEGNSAGAVHVRRDYTLYQLEHQAKGTPDLRIKLKHLFACVQATWHTSSRPTTIRWVA